MCSGALLGTIGIVDIYAIRIQAHIFRSSFLAVFILRRQRWRKSWRENAKRLKAVKLRQEASRSIEGARNPHHCSRGGIGGIDGKRLDIFRTVVSAMWDIFIRQLWRKSAEMATCLAWWGHETRGRFWDETGWNFRQVTNASFACTPLNVVFFRAQNQHLLLLHTAAYVDVESTSMAEDPAASQPWMLTSY